MARRRIFTEATFAEIARDVADRVPAVEIAARLGCTLGTLRVRCSLAGLSLRTGIRRPPAQAPPVALSVTIPHAIATQIEKRAKTKGVTGNVLAGRLLETIVTDDLFAAVLGQ